MFTTNLIFKINFTLWFFAIWINILGNNGIIGEYGAVTGLGIIGDPIIPLLILSIIGLTFIFTGIGIIKIIGLIINKLPVPLEGKIFCLLLIIYFLYSFFVVT